MFQSKHIKRLNPGFASLSTLHLNDHAKFYCVWHAKRIMADATEIYFYVLKNSLWGSVMLHFTKLCVDGHTHTQRFAHVWYKVRCDEIGYDLIGDLLFLPVQSLAKDRWGPNWLAGSPVSLDRSHKITFYRWPAMRW